MGNTPPPQKEWVRLGLPRTGVCLTSYKHLHPHVGYHDVAVGQTVRANVRTSAKDWALRVSSFKVTQGHRN